MSMVTVRVAAAVALLYAARRYYRNWGTTKEECRSWLLGDELVRQPFTRTTEGVWIDAPPSEVWPALVQVLHLDGEPAPGAVVRVAPAGWIKRLNHSLLTVQQMVTGESVVLRGSPPEFPWDAVWSFHVQPRWEDRCRLLLRMRANLRHPGDVVKVELAGPVTALSVRATLRAVKHRAESAYDRRSEPSTPMPIPPPGPDTRPQLGVPAAGQR